MFQRVHDGVCRPIPPSEFLAWAEMMEEIVYPAEYDILAGMDAAYCLEFNKELDGYKARQQEAHQRRIEEAQKGTK